MTETPEHLVLSAVVPGFSERDLDVQLSKDVLCITGRYRSRVPADFTALELGRRSGDFRSEIKLLSEVCSSQTEAELARGILTIRLRKDAPSSRPAIPIRLP